MDALASTAEAADACGLELLAAATIRSALPRTEQAKGMRRTEHAILLQAPEA